MSGNITKIDSSGGMHTGTTGIKISVIMPVFNAVDYIVQSLPPLIEMLGEGEIIEIIVVDDSSTDETLQVAERLGARVIPSGGRLGPGGARNCGARVADGDVLWFVDADVVVETGAVHKLIEGFSDPDIVAVFGSYDDRPAAQNFLSQYKNLIHHYYHHRTSQEASTFWSGCGAVRKEAFIQTGGFNAEMICAEDIDLGYRLRDAGGRILLRPDLRGTHLKEWRLLNLLHTEIFCRAIPWSRLMLRRKSLHNDLNISYDERIRAGLAGLLLIVLVLALSGLVPWSVPCGAGILVAYANRKLFAFFRKQKGVGFAILATLFHQLYYLYSSAAFVWCWIEVRILGLHQRQTST